MDTDADRRQSYTVEHRAALDHLDACYYVNNILYNNILDTPTHRHSMHTS
jgi:hypothetical protein